MTTSAMLARRAEAPLSKRLAINEMIAGLSARLSQCPADVIDEEINNAVQLLLEAEAADPSSWVAISQSDNRGQAQGRERGSPAKQGLGHWTDLPWSINRLLLEDAAGIASRYDLPVMLNGNGSQAAAGRGDFRPSEHGFGTNGRSASGRAGNSHQVGLNSFLIGLLNVLVNVLAGALRRKGDEEERNGLPAREAPDAPPIGVAIVDRDGRVVTTNEALGAMLGYDQEELSSGFLFQSPHPEDAERDGERVQDVLSGLRQSCQSEKRYLRKDGTVIWVRLTCSRFSDPPQESNLVLLTLEDITAQKEMREQCKRHRGGLSSALESLGISVWDWDLQSGQAIWSGQQLLLFDTPAEEELERAFRQVLAEVHPEDRSKLMKAVAEMLAHGKANDVQRFASEYRLMNTGDSTRWALGKAQVSRDASGRPARVLGLNMDITELKRAEATDSRLAARLLQAQEEERERIGRELHDDIGQRLSLLRVALEMLLAQLPNERSGNHASLTALLQTTDEIITDVHHLSYDLHSSKLRHLGLKTALRDLCHTISSQHRVEIDLREGPVSDAIPQDVSLCFYRVAQEALSNIVKHSGAKRVRLTLRRLKEQLRMRIRDFGAGFDPACASGGLGLASMRERLRIIGGTILLDSRPGWGTELTADAPYPDSSRHGKAGSWPEQDYSPLLPEKHGPC